MTKINATSEYYGDKVAVVTGDASGIGLALAETMLARHLTQDARGKAFAFEAQ